MSVPKAVSPSIKTPGLYLTVDLTAGVASPGTGVLRTALICPQSASGDLIDDTEVRAGTGSDSAATAFGSGTYGHLAAKQIYNIYPAAQVDFIAPVAGETAATLAVTMASSPTSDVVIYIDICGREFTMVWAAEETADECKATMIDAINDRTADLPVTASSGGTGIVTITSKVTGKIGNDVIVRMRLSEQTASETINTGTSFATNLAGGTTDPDLTNALAALEGREYHFILPCLSNADVANVASSNNLDKIYNHIIGLNTGLDAKLQTFRVGYTGTLALAIATTPHVNSCNDAAFGELLLCISGRSLPCELGAREVAGWLKALSTDAAANRIGELLTGISGAYDKIADKPTPAESESALNAGVSIVSYTQNDSEVLVRAITTHGSDDRILDVQNCDAAYIVARDVRDNLPLAFPQAKIMADAPPGSDPPPAGVLEERDVKAWCTSRLRKWAEKGTINGPALDTAIEDGSLIVQIDDEDPTQLNIVLPYEIIQPLAKFGVVAQRVPS